jgi:hypothetical protein
MGRGPRDHRFTMSTRSTYSAEDEGRCGMLTLFPRSDSLQACCLETGAAGAWRYDFNKQERWVSTGVRGNIRVLSRHFNRKAVRNHK